MTKAIHFIMVKKLFLKPMTLPKLKAVMALVQQSYKVKTTILIFQ